MGKFFEKIKDSLFDGLTVTIYQTKFRVRELKEYSVIEEENTTTLSFNVNEEIKKVELKIIENDTSCAVFIDALVDNGNWCAGNFKQEKTIGISFKPDCVEKALGSTFYGRWWKEPVFTEDVNSLTIPMQNLLLKIGDLHYEVLPLIGDNFRVDIEKGQLFLTPDMAGVYHLEGGVCSISASTDPYKAIHNAFTLARETGALRIPLKSERKYPKSLEGFGFCTWDAFYLEVTSEKIYKKLDEFKEKNIPVQWLMIDDGWMSTDQGYLISFKEDKEKFPEGLKQTVTNIKEKYGVKYVGVWHTIHGYWDGIKEDSELFIEQKDNLFKTVRGVWVPSIDIEKGYTFWNTWHSYLKSCGIDLVKVDSQASVPLYWEGTMETAKAARLVHLIFEKSVFNNFEDGCVINCMGMDIENVLNRPYSAVNRNSDDFSPRNEKDFLKHVTQNCYNSLWHDEIYYCDFDMWWSKHNSAVMSGVLRAVSGSPVYVSDELGNSNPETIIPIIENDGTLIRCDNACKPTLDCLYRDSRTTKTILKAFNTSGENIVLAAFNLSDENLTESFEASNIPVINPSTEYAGYEYFDKKWEKIDLNSKIEISLAPNSAKVWSIYPIDKDGNVNAGDLTKYVSAATREKTVIKPNI